MGTFHKSTKRRVFETHTQRQTLCHPFEAEENDVIETILHSYQTKINLFKVVSTKTKLIILIYMILTLWISVQCLVTSFFKQSNENSPSSRDVYNFKQITMFLFLQNRSGFSVLFFAKIVFLHNISIFAESVWFPYFCFFRNCFSSI